jgi:hypothetical protein
MKLQKDLRLIIADELAYNSEKYQEEIWGLVRAGLERLSDLECKDLAERMSVNTEEEKC